MRVFVLIASISSFGVLAATPEWPYCEEIIELYNINQTTPLGFSGLDLINLTNNIESVVISYGYKQGQTNGFLEFDQVAPIARYVHAKAVYPTQGYDIGIVCADRVEVDVRIFFDSYDGAFADSWETTLRSEQPEYCTTNICPQAGEYAKFSVFLSKDDLQGTFYEDAFEKWEGGVLSGVIKTGELDAQISHSTCVCDDSSCVTMLSVDATIKNQETPLFDADYPDK